MAPTANKKPPGRQTNNSLSSLGEHDIVISHTNTLQETASSPRKKKVKPTEVFTETDEVLQIGMHKVLEHVKNHDDAWPFMDPVEEDIAPRYYSIIRRPMDLQKMEEKLDSGEYGSFSEFKNDFKLIVNNCRLYNGQNNEYTEMVNNLQLAFEKATKKYFDQNSSDEETSFDYLDIKSDAFHEKVLSEKIKNKKFILGMDSEEEEENDENEMNFKKSDTKRLKMESISSLEESKIKQRGRSLSPPEVKEAKKKEVKKDKSKENFDLISESLKKRDRKKIIKEIRKKHKGKHIKGKIKKEKGRPKGSSSSTKKSEVALVHSEVESEIFFTDDEPTMFDNKPKELKEKKHKKENHKSKKEKKKSKNSDGKPKKLKKEALDFSSDSSSIQDLPSSSPKRSLSSSNISRDSSPDSSSGLEDLSYSASTSRTKKDDIKKEKRKVGRPRKEGKEIEPGLHKKKKKQKEKKKKEGKKIVDNKDSLFSDAESNLSFNHDEGSRGSSLSRPITPDIQDKFDLIKNRRRQKAAETTPVKEKEKENQREEKKKSKDEKKVSKKSESKEKNQTLKETIEKLKKKSKKSKEGAEIFDEIFGVKPSKHLKEKDEKTIYRKLRETYGEDENRDKKVPKVAGKQPKSISEYDFIDDLAPNVLPPVVAERKIASPTFSSPKIKKDKPSKKMAAPLAKMKPRIDKSANLEALELETEQTLKDINKWLELTPHMSEFGSASSSPSRYMIDDLDSIPAAGPRPETEYMRSTSIQENQENRQNLNSQFDALKNEGATKGGLQDQNGVVSKKVPADPIKDVLKSKPSTVPSVGKQPPHVASTQRKMTKLLNYVPPRKKEHLRTIDRLQPGKSKGNLLSAIKPTGPMPTAPLVPKVKEIKNSLIVETSETGPKLSLGTVLDAEGFGLVQQHNFQDDVGKEKEINADDEDDDKPDEESKDDEVRWGAPEPSKKGTESDKKSVSDGEKESNDVEKKGDEPKPNLSAWFKAFGVPKKPLVATTASKDGESLSQVLGVDPSSNQPTMRQRKSSTGSTTSELSSVSQDPDSPRITIDESYSYRSPVQLPIVTSPKPEEGTSTFLSQPRQTTPFEMPNGPIKVGFYQDTTKCSPEKSPQEQYAQHRTPPSRDSYSYYSNSGTTSTPVEQPKPPTISASMYHDQYGKVTTAAVPTTKHDEPYENSSSSPNPNSPYQNQPLSPYTPNSPYSQQHTSPASVPASAAAAPFQAQNTPSLTSSASISSSTSKSPYNLPEVQPKMQEKIPEPPQYQYNPQQAHTQEQLKDSSSPPEHHQNLAQYGQQQSLKSQTIAPSWNTPGLYSNMDKSLFPLSLTNTNQSNVQDLNPQQQQHPFSLAYSGQSSSSTNSSANSSALQSSSPSALSLVAKEQDTRKQQQHSINPASHYDKMPIDYAQPDRYKNLDMYNRTFNKALASTTETSQASGNSGGQQSQVMPQQQPQGAHSQPSSTADLHSYYMQRGASQIPATDYTIAQNQRYDLSRQTPAAHQQPTMSNMNYKGSTAEYMRNFASMMAEMGLPGASQNSYSQQFVKNFHQVTTAALQQFLPGSTMTTMAYGGKSREDDVSSRQPPPSHVQPPPSASKANYHGQPHVAHSQTPSQTMPQYDRHQQQQQHMAYTQKFNEAATLGQPPEIVNVPKKSSKSSKTASSKSKSRSQVSATSLTPPDAHSSQQYTQQYFSKQGVPTATDTTKTSSAIPPGVPGSAFNFGPTPTGPLGLYGDAASNYLEDFRGAANPYSAYLGHPRAPPQAEMSAAAAAAAAAVDKSGNSSSVSSPYHQFLSHPTARAGYPFPTPFDPLQQQWNLQRQEELRAQMMLASNPYSQSGYPRHLWG